MCEPCIQTRWTHHSHSYFIDTARNSLKEALSRKIIPHHFLASASAGVLVVIWSTACTMLWSSSHMALYTILCLFTADCPSNDEEITSILQKQQNLMQLLQVTDEGDLHSYRFFTKNELHIRARYSPLHRKRFHSRNMLQAMQFDLKHHNKKSPILTFWMA